MHYTQKSKIMPQFKTDEELINYLEQIATGKYSAILKNYSDCVVSIVEDRFSGVLRVVYSIDKIIAKAVANGQPESEIRKSFDIMANINHPWPFYNDSAPILDRTGPVGCVIQIT